MPVQFHKRVFEPGLPGTLLALVALAGLANLGFWQLRRADEKREMLAVFAAGQQSTVAFSADNAADLPRYQRVTVAGKYESGRQVLLDNMPSSTGIPGYHVLTPLRLDEGGLVLVNRGWLPLGANRSVLPQVDVDDRRRELVALTDELPRPGMRLGETEGATGSWPRVLNFPLHEQLVMAYGEPLLRPVLKLDAAAESGFERVWEARFGMSPLQHVGYAVQWFALCGTLLVIFLVVNRKARRTQIGTNGNRE